MDKSARIGPIALGLLGVWTWTRMTNLQAFLALLRQAESGDDYSVIAGGDHFDDFSEHPFIVDPQRPRPLGTTASGAYQITRPTWIMARDGAGLADFSPTSQDAAGLWILRYKVPGHNAVNPEGTGNYELVQAGNFDAAMAALGPEWESLSKMIAGRYPITLAQAREIIVAQGGVYASASA